MQSGRVSDNPQNDAVPRLLEFFQTTKKSTLDRFGLGVERSHDIVGVAGALQEVAIIRMLLPDQEYATLLPLAPRPSTKRPRFGINNGSPPVSVTSQLSAAVVRRLKTSTILSMNVGSR